MAVIHRDVVSITGGGAGDNVRFGWIAHVVSRDGKEFIALDKTDTKFGKFVSQNFAMTDAIVKARNRATNMLMKRAEAAFDPMGEVQEAKALKRPRKEMLDEIDDAIEVAVQVLGGEERTLLVMTACGLRHKLHIELSEENLLLLREKPACHDPATFRPDIQEANVGWMDSRHAVYCRYFDSCDRKWHLKIMKVDLADDMQARVDKMAKVCQSFFDLHHTEPTNNGGRDGQEALTL
jgi:hypothetical protein